METQMIIRLDSEIKSKMAKLAQSEGKNASQVVRELIDNYIQERDISTYIDNLWDRIGDKLSSRGFEVKDIEKTIKEIRMEKHEGSN